MSMEVEAFVPPGFRFHPTEEELVGYYLTRKVNSQSSELGFITDIDLYRIEPWDLQSLCKLGYEEQSEWYFFSHKDKKYPTGTRTNRATTAGFWKATGRDKVVLSKLKMIGMRKTLVFYKGRAPNGRKTDWIMHEYRLQTSEHAPPQEEGWVVCRAFKKQSPNQRRSINPWDHSNYYIRDQNIHVVESQTFADHVLSPTKLMDSSHSALTNFHEQYSPFHCEEDGSSTFVSNKHSTHLTQLLQLPHLDSPSLPSGLGTPKEVFGHLAGTTSTEDVGDGQYDQAQLVDWKTLDNFLASQLTDPVPCSNSKLPIIHSDYDQMF